MPSSPDSNDGPGADAILGREIVLVLGGGNALGAYLAGACQQLDERGIRLDRIVGSSVGAVTGAILAGNAPERRIRKLKEYWAGATQRTHAAAAPSTDLRLRQLYNGAHAALALAVGRPTLFGPRYPGLWSILPGMPDDVALHDQAPLRRTLLRLVDFDRLNRAEVRFTLACTDLETGEDVYFDNTREAIGPDHLLASTAIAPLFPPVEIGGRLLCDPGFTNNLPLEPVFDPPPERDLVCLAVDLFSLRSPRPASLDAALERAQDLAFASAAKRSIKALRREYALRAAAEPNGPRVRLVHLAYRAADHELVAKMLDFSPSSVRDRWAAGRRDMASGLDLLGRPLAGDRGRFEYLAVDPRDATTAAEPGATARDGSAGEHDRPASGSMPPEAPSPAACAG
jgi:NTE family protein